MISQWLCFWAPPGEIVSARPLTYLLYENKSTPNEPINPNSNAVSKTLPQGKLAVHTAPSLLQDKILNYRHTKK